MSKAIKKPHPGGPNKAIGFNEFDKIVRRPVIDALKSTAGDWQVQKAKAQFSELFRRARTEGPQHITRQGKEGVVMISDEQYERLTAKAHQPKSIVQFFRESPLVGVELALERDKDTGRDVDL